MNIKKLLSTLLLIVTGAVSFAQGNAGATVDGQKSRAVEPKRNAVVELSSIYMRLGADYESPLETMELLGTVVEIVNEKGYWREIVTPQPYKAWCTELGLVEMSEEEIREYNESRKVMYTQLYGHLYSEPSFSSNTIRDLVGGDVLRLVRRGHRWTEVMLPSGKKGFIPNQELKDFDGFRTISKGEGNSDSVSEAETDKFISSALSLLGSPYLWGGMTPKGVDCSGLVRWSYLMNGILLPRNASQMIFCGDPVEMRYDISFWDESKRTDSDAFLAEMKGRIANLKRGDLVFFGTPANAGQRQKVTHVGIYLGDGKMIHSSHLVRINSLLPSDDEFYENSYRLLGAVRL